MSKEKKSKKVVFSEEIDSIISGLTLGFAFIIIGVFLILVPDYFGRELVGEMVRWIFIVIGFLGLFVEFGKLKPMSNIKGFDNLWAGVFCLAIWATIFLIAKHWLWNVIGFFFLIIGVYGVLRGIFEIIYSIYQNQKNKVQKKGIIFSDMIVFFTKVVSLIIVVVQLVQALQ